MGTVVHDVSDIPLINTGISEFNKIKKKFFEKD